MNPRFYNSSSYNSKGKSSSRSGISYSLPTPEEFRVIILTDSGEKITLNDPAIYNIANQGNEYHFRATSNTFYMKYFEIKLHHYLTNISIIS